MAVAPVAPDVSWPVCDKWLVSDWMSGARAIHTHTTGISHRQYFSFTWKMLRRRDKTFIYLEGNIDCFHYPKWDIGVFIPLMMSRTIVTVTGHKADGLRHSHSADKMGFQILNKVRPFNWRELGSSIEIFQFMFHDKNFYLHKIFLPIWATKFQKSNIYVKDILKNIPCILSPGWDSLPENI